MMMMRRCCNTSLPIAVMTRSGRVAALRRRATAGAPAAAASSSITTATSDARRTMAAATRTTTTMHGTYNNTTNTSSKNETYYCCGRSFFHSSVPARQRMKTTFHLPCPSERENFVAPLTKIVATIGPTSEQAEPLLAVTAAGMRIMRLNFSHATKEEVQLRVTNLAAAQRALSPKDSNQVQTTRAIMLDTKGPEIRTGTLQNDHSGHETVHLAAGATVTLHTSNDVRDAGSTATDLYVDYPSLAKAMEAGQKVLLDDGAVVLTVQSTDTAAGTVTCAADNSGDVRSRAGVNLPGADTTDLPAMSEKDKADILYGMEAADIDFVAASFVQSASGVAEIRQHIADCARKLGWPDDKPLPLIISKIETAGSLRHFDDILDASDAIMVARGDLGVEIPLVQVVNAQKEMIAACNAAGKPVIVATQMLESMSKNPRPTRAEVADVTNAVYDGADCCMTSGETAKGKYPEETITTMSNILGASEHFMHGNAMGHLDERIAGGSKFYDPPATPTGELCKQAAAEAAAAAAKEKRCTAILLVPSDEEEERSMAQIMAALRPSVPILAPCSDAKRARQLQLHRGVHPILVDGSTLGSTTTEKGAALLEEAKSAGWIRSGEGVLVVSGGEGFSLT